MITLISFLRGINVGGSNKILMSDLKSLYEEQGFEKVITFIQSGNVIFQTQEETIPNELSFKIEHAILHKLGVKVSVILRTLEEMQKIVSNNPFTEKKEIIEEKLHVTFLADFPETIFVQAIEKYDYSPEKFAIIGKDVFLYCPNGYGKTKLSNIFFENRLKLKATTRNWKTTKKLFEIALSQKLNQSKENQP